MLWGRGDEVTGSLSLGTERGEAAGATGASARVEPSPPPGRGRSTRCTDVDPGRRPYSGPGRGDSGFAHSAPQGSTAPPSSSAPSLVPTPDRPRTSAGADVRYYPRADLGLVRDLWRSVPSPCTGDAPGPYPMSPS